MGEQTQLCVVGAGAGDGYWTIPKENKLIWKVKWLFTLWRLVSETMERLPDSLGRSFHSQHNTMVFK